MQLFQNRVKMSYLFIRYSINGFRLHNVHRVQSSDVTRLISDNELKLTRVKKIIFAMIKILLMIAFPKMPY